MPVLVLPTGEVIEESLAVMAWALGQHDPGDWRRAGDGPAAANERAQIAALIDANDGTFKVHLDRYKYAHRFAGADPLAHRQATLDILRDWNARLELGGWLLGGAPPWPTSPCCPSCASSARPMPAGSIASPIWPPSHLAGTLSGQPRAGGGDGAGAALGSR
ncbi:hypothetical protein [Cyanobium sp. ATX-6F1]|uniref:hypothetical protein n=1 Tax=Cyanobium sp. ATX-6F1 TaxID=3137388 RepID=UPI0039BDF17D